MTGNGDISSGDYSGGDDEEDGSNGSSFSLFSFFFFLYFLFRGGAGACFHRLNLILLELSD